MDFATYFNPLISCFFSGLWWFIMVGLFTPLSGFDSRRLHHIYLMSSPCHPWRCSILFNKHRPGHPWPVVMEAQVIKQTGDPSVIATIVDEGALKPRLDPHSFTLEQVSDAHTLLETGQARGKIVIAID